MDDKMIDLGKEVDMKEDGSAVYGYPEDLEEVDGKKMRFPSIYLSDLSSDPNLKDEGYALIKYKVRERGERENDKNGKTFRIELDIKSIGQCDGPEEKEEKKSDGEASDDAIEQGLKEAEKKD